MTKYDWSTIPKKWKWCATDENKMKTFFTHKPKMNTKYCEWLVKTGDYHVYMGGGSYQGDWRDSLEERPK